MDFKYEWGVFEVLNFSKKARGTRRHATAPALPS
jgi:hypothetical protein